MSRFLIIAERIEGGRILQEDYDTHNTVPILQRARQELAAGAKYLDLTIGETDHPVELMQWGVELLQSHFEDVPLAFESGDLKAVEAALKVYNPRHGKAILNYADTHEHADFLDLAAETDSICICRCSRGLIPENNDERLAVCSELLEKALRLGMDTQDLLFNPVLQQTKAMQERQEETLEAITLISEMGLLTTGGISKVALGAPKPVRSVLCAAFSAMAMQCGLSSGILNPLDKKVMETVIAADMIKNNILYTDRILKNYLSDEENRFKTE